MELLVPGFEFEAIYVYDAVDLGRVLPQVQGQKFVKLWFDEAKNLLYKRLAMTRLNKKVSQWMSQVRELNGTRFWCSPDMEELEGFLVKDQMDVLLTVPSRGELICWKFWKNYHKPPGQREGRWTTVFKRRKSNPLPWMGDLDPAREREYRTWKTLGFNRVHEGLAEALLEKDKRTSKTMSIGIRDDGVSPPTSPDRLQELLESRKKGPRTRN